MDDHRSPRAIELGKHLSAYTDDDGKVVIECEDTYYTTVLTDEERRALGALCTGEHLLVPPGDEE